MHFCGLQLNCLKLGSSRAVLDHDFEEVKLASLAVGEVSKTHSTKTSVLKRFVKLLKRKDRTQHAIAAEGNLKVSVPATQCTDSLSFAKCLPDYASQATTPCLFINAAPKNQTLAPSSIISCSSVNGRTPAAAKAKPAFRMVAPSPYSHSCSEPEDDLDSFASTPLQPDRLADCDNDVVVIGCPRNHYPSPARTPVITNDDLTLTPEHIRRERELPIGVLVVKTKVDRFIGQNAYTTNLFVTSSLAGGCVETLWNNPYGDMFEPLEFKLVH